MSSHSGSCRCSGDGGSKKDSCPTNRYCKCGGTGDCNCFDCQCEPPKRSREVAAVCGNPYCPCKGECACPDCGRTCNCMPPGALNPESYCSSDGTSGSCKCTSDGASGSCKCSSGKGDSSSGPACKCPPTAAAACACLFGSGCECSKGRPCTRECTCDNCPGKADKSGWKGGEKGGEKVADAEETKPCCG